MTSGPRRVGASIPLDGCVGWFEGDSLASLSDGGDVTTWPDQSGNGNDATQGTVARKPHYKAAIVNGRGVVRFSGTADEYLTLPDIWSGATSAEGFFVQIANANPAPDFDRAGWCSMGTGSSSHYPYTDGTVYVGFATGRQDLGTFGGTTITAWHLAHFANDNDWWSATPNGGPVTKILQGSATFGVPTAPLIGRSDSTYRFDGDMAMVALYDRVLSDAERGQVETYITRHYGIALG